MSPAAWVELREYGVLTMIGAGMILARLIRLVVRLVAQRRRPAPRPLADETPTAPFWRPRLPFRTR